MIINNKCNLPLQLNFKVRNIMLVQMSISFLIARKKRKEEMSLQNFKNTVSTFLLDLYDSSIQEEVS